MPRRTRTSKSLAQRIDLDYFRRPARLRRLKFLLSVGLAGAAGAWLLLGGVAGQQKVYSSGPLSPPHAFLANECEACHQPQGRTFLKHVRDGACKSCHDGPLHQENAAATPDCAECHAEHRGSVALARVADTTCTGCHADLRPKSGPTRFAKDIRDFGGNHPEFAAVRAGKDPGAIKLNHQVHLKRDLKGPNGPVQMTCADCHRSSATAAPWPYAAAGVRTAVAPVSGPLSPALMGEIKYAKHCQACHVLQFDRRFAEPVPHDKPEVVRSFVLKKLSEYIAAHPDEVRQAWVPDARIPGKKPSPRIARNAPEWVSFRMEEAELLLWRKTCKECHTLEGSGPVPEVRKAQITARWMAHAEFDHRAHRGLDCAACHQPAPTSKETSDLLLPGIATCRACHTSLEPQPTSGASARCAECHDYHDWSKEKPVDGTFWPRTLRGKAAPATPAATAGQH